MLLSEDVVRENKDRKNEKKMTVTMANLTPDDKDAKRRTTMCEYSFSQMRSEVLFSILNKPMFLQK